VGQRRFGVGGIWKRPSTATKISWLSNPGRSPDRVQRALPATRLGFSALSGRRGTGSSRDRRACRQVLENPVSIPLVRCISIAITIFFRRSDPRCQVEPSPSVGEGWVGVELLRYNRRNDGHPIPRLLPICTNKRMLYLRFRLVSGLVYGDCKPRATTSERRSPAPHPPPLYRPGR